jgi:hypothetical protein
MKSKDSWLQDILRTTPILSRTGYELVRTVCADNPTLAPQIVEDLLQQREPYYQLLGLYGITLLASPTWEPLLLKLTHHTDPEVKNSALRALGVVGTKSSIHHLLTLARQEYDGALWALKKLMVRFPEYAAQIFDLAEQLLLSENAQVREQAAAIIVKLGKIQEVEEALLQSAERFADEFTLDALKRASEAILPRLKKLKTRFTQEGAEYQDIVRTIDALEERHKALVPEIA